MQQFTGKYQDQIQGVLSGFDRLIFRGSLRRLNYGYPDRKLHAAVAQGMEQYLCLSHILFKHYSSHVKRVSEELKKESLRIFHQHHVPVVFLRSPRVDKEELARKIAAENRISVGPVCAISTLEPSATFEHRGTHIIRRERPCHVLYQYWIDEQLGWMHGRIQTWFPFNLQIGINGREWLARHMDREGLKYRQQGNCFVWIEDYAQAQKLMNRQLETDWAELLNGWAQRLNPIREEVFRHYPTSYYWTCYQSEWASDVSFASAGFLQRLMPRLVRHGMLSFSSPDVLRYFGKRLNANGAIPKYFRGSLQTDVKDYREGERVKYRMNGNSIKFYDKAYQAQGSVLRVETTLNRVKDFRVFRPKEGGPEADLQWRPMRMGIADLNRRAQVSEKANQRMLDALAAVDDTQSVEQLTRQIQKPVLLKGGRVRGLCPWGEDRELLEAIHHGEFLINGFRNRDLQKLLYGEQPAGSDREGRRRSAKVSRILRMLKMHGLIHKVGNTHRYHVTAFGRTVVPAVLTTARTTLHQLNRLQEAA